MNTSTLTTPASPAIPSGDDYLKPNVRISVPVASTPAEAARILTVSRRKLADLLATGRLKSIRIGRRRVIRRCDLEKFLGTSLA